MDTKTLGEQILEAHLKGILKVLQSDSCTAADRAVALKTLEALEVDMAKAAGKKARAGLAGAITDTLPFAGSQGLPN